MTTVGYALVKNITLILEAINGTDDGPSKEPAPYVAPPIMKKIHDILIVVLLICVMFAMGCSITWEQVSPLLMLSIISFISPIFYFDLKISYV
jgi:hypothetical protein